jgi:transcriptional regulator with XRE-family HTH domain
MGLPVLNGAIWTSMSDAIDSHALGQRLRLLRLARGVSGAEMARVAKVLPQTWSDYEKGRIRPSVDVLANLRRSSGVRIEWLLFGDLEDQMPLGLMRDIHAVEAKLASGNPTRANNH